MLSYTTAGGERREVVCDAIAGCDGFHGICRPAIPAGLLTVRDRDYPYAWLGIMAEVPPSTDELIYTRHPDGFALHSHAHARRSAGSTCRSARTSRSRRGPTSGSGRRSSAGSRCPAGS